MGVKFLIPNMEKTFGALEFAGQGEDIFDYVNGRRTVVNRSYNLYSSIQKADNVSVRIPSELRVRNFDYEEEIQLLNPRIELEANRVGERSYTNYVLYADDIVKKGLLIEK
jgi:Bacterial protein of unknown function (DUF961).